MTKVISPGRLGLVMAALIGGFHFLWAAIVAFGWAQPLINVIFWLHFIRPIYVVSPFDWRIAALLVSFTALVGYGIGGAFALWWNRMHGAHGVQTAKGGAPLTQP